MAIVYLEELIKHVPNKYLAVNVIAKRARSLNDELLGAGLSQKQKPVTVATEELASGKLSYKQLDPKVSEPEEKSMFTSEAEGYDAVDKDEHIAELFGKNPTEDSETETDEESDADAE
jgi:DNA-directed RNA polymerase subunit omega